MKSYEYGVASPDDRRLRTSIVVRPKSQQPRMSSESFRSPIAFSVPQEDLGRKSFQMNQMTSQYYMHAKQNMSPELRYADKKNSQKVELEPQKFEKWKRSVAEKVQKKLLQLREQIFKQSSLIMQLQKRIEKQERDIESKNNTIQCLIGKMQQLGYISKGQGKCQASQSFLQRKISDLEAKLRLVLVQGEQQKEEVYRKLDHLTFHVLKHFGGKILQIKKTMIAFIIGKEVELKEMEDSIEKATSNGQLSTFYRAPNDVKNDLKDSSNGSVRETCSSVNSKESLPIEKPVSKKRKDESILSDYFFYAPSSASQPSSANIQAMQQLVKDRQQLPIRVFVDGSGRLKYWQSRTFIFDRRGNYTLPSGPELQEMESRGWVKVVE